MLQNIKVIRDDITQLSVDAIVNAANTTLLGGGGVDGAIHRAAGPELLAECQTLKGCPVGEAKMTKAYNLPAKHIIHAVGPVWHGGIRREPELLAKAYQSCLTLAVEHNLSSIAFPNISTGAYRFPKEQAAEIAIATVRHFLQNHPQLEVTFVCYDIENYERYKQLLDMNH